MPLIKDFPNRTSFTGTEQIPVNVPGTPDADARISLAALRSDFLSYVAPNGSQAYVEAHKGSTSQTGMGVGSWTTVTWPITLYDTASRLDGYGITVEVGEEWLFMVNCKTLQAFNANLVQLAIYKESERLKLLAAGASYASGMSFGGTFFVRDPGYYDFRMTSPVGQALSVDGDDLATWLIGIRTK